jgi:hypothetical protein
VNKPAGARVGQHAREGLGRAAGRQRRHHHAGAQRAQVDGGVVDGGGGAEGDGVPGLQAVALQRGGDPVHAGVERGVVDGADRGAAFANASARRCGSARACSRIRSGIARKAGGLGPS